ncbi:hypothetical protein ANCCEY_03628 [Ancylostoma ceylanicum]|uniref:Peptidase M1 membrane alanine aminopeptidase domain-containing protein n=1 Tax=Ancylostoma ceylanicum TaxID=53326 RepID=A0A0D6MAY1_9BILA|nr:hypothetical protein ANCCEY_03628 [Ancylostoma ceylanicum]
MLSDVSFARSEIARPCLHYPHKIITRQTSFGVTVRVHATSHAVAIRVLDIAIDSFELLASIMEIPLPLNKVDFILVPDYDGGMENWGHVLLSENLATYGDDAHLTYVIAHELAHHWIGNKATVDSWRHLPKKPSTRTHQESTEIVVLNMRKHNTRL